MSRATRLLTGAALTAVILLTGCHGAGSADLPLPTVSEIRATTERALEGSGVPGGAVIVTGPGAAETLHVFGNADMAIEGDPVGEERAVAEDTPFAYRSITKSFVGTVVLQLADEGKLSLDDPVSAYVDGVPGGDDITIRELGTMRSGIANYSALPGFGELFAPDPMRDPGTAELLDLAYAASPEFAPGTAYEYSNTNTLLLGQVIERVTGAPWFESVHVRILEPLRLASVAEGFADPAVDARGFQLADGTAVERLPQIPPNWFGAAGSLTGSVRDLAVWGDALGSGALLDRATQEERLASLGPIADDPASPEYDRYGFAMGEIDGWVGHTGNGLGFQALVMHEENTGRTVAILLNGTGDDPDAPAHLFRALQSESLGL